MILKGTKFQLKVWEYLKSIPKGELRTYSQVAIAIGTVTVSADANLTPSGNQVVISSGTVSITGSANIDPTKASFTLSTGTVSAITWSEIIPGATMTWTAIDEC